MLIHSSTIWDLISAVVDRRFLLLIEKMKKKHEGMKIEILRWKSPMSEKSSVNGKIFSLDRKNYNYHYLSLFLFMPHISLGFPIHRVFIGYG